MGLKSLPMLNKSGISMYWHNIWDSLKLYKKYSLSFFFLNGVINHFLNENLYYYCIMKIRPNELKLKGFKGNKNININKIKKSWNMRHFYLGKILFLKYQGWVLVLINYYCAHRNKLYINYKSFKAFKKIAKSFRHGITNYTYKIDKYKFKF